MVIGITETLPGRTEISTTPVPAAFPPGPKSYGKQETAPLLVHASEVLPVPFVPPLVVPPPLGLLVVGVVVVVVVVVVVSLPVPEPEQSFQVVVVQVPEDVVPDEVPVSVLVPEPPVLLVEVLVVVVVAA